MIEPTSDPKMVTQVRPEERQLPLEGLYLRQRLAELAARMGKALVLTTYITDRNGVIAKADKNHDFQVPPETRNASDWRLSQELMAQADVIISGGDHLRRASARGSHAQDVLRQFEPGGEFEELGAWRLQAGYENRSPDLAVVARHLDFKIPEEGLKSGRRSVVFTTDSMAESEQARAFADAGTAVLGCGQTGVDGRTMIDHLREEMGARVIVMTSGPGVLELLLRAKLLDLLYLTQVQREIAFDDPSMVKMLRPDGKSVQDLDEFGLTQEYLEEGAVTADGSVVSQIFRRYDRI